MDIDEDIKFEKTCDKRGGQNTGDQGEYFGNRILETEYWRSIGK